MRDQPGVPRCFKPTKPAPSGLSPSYFSLAAAMVVKSSSEKRLGSGERLSSFSTLSGGGAEAERVDDEGSRAAIRAPATPPSSEGACGPVEEGRGAAVTVRKRVVRSRRHDAVKRRLASSVVKRMADGRMD